LTKLALLNSPPQAHSSVKNKRKWQLAFLALGLLLPYMQCVADNAPNIIIILADDPSVALKRFPARCPI
jgi:hypothetical protein